MTTVIIMYEMNYLARARYVSSQYRIRINDQWRICFTWQDGEADEVEIVDYHKGK